MSTRLDRRAFLRYTMGMASATALGAACTTSASRGPDPGGGAAAAPGSYRWSEATIADMQTAMASGETTSLALVRDHIERIERLDWAGPRVNSMIEVNPDAEAIATELDRERADGRVRGPLHGVPITLKDCIATADRMQTTAGSLALEGARTPRDAGVVGALRRAGAVILGKNNMSEWNAYRGWPLHGGWSGRAGIGLNPYALRFSTGDSSSGSAAAVAASFTAGAIGLETYGSIVMPSSLCGVVGLKPTLGLVGRSGTIPISFSRDVLGPIARTVEDLATVLGAIAGVDPLDELSAARATRAPSDYRSVLDLDGLRGARLGVWRRRDLWRDEQQAAVIEDALDVLRGLGAEVVDDVEIADWAEATGLHNEVMYVELRPGIERYLGELSQTEIRTLADVIAFNEAHADAELRYHSQNLLESANEAPPLDDDEYRRSLNASQRLGRAGLSSAMRDHRLDAIVAPTFRPSWFIDLLAGDDPTNGNGAAGPSNAAGYPHLTLPAGFVGELPVGLSFLAGPWEEPKLLRFAYAFEQATKARRAPRFLDGYAVEDFVER